MRCDLLVKGTQVEGVYDSDPKVNQNAKKYNVISYDDILEKGLKVMDFTAISTARDHKLPVLVFNIHKSGELKKVINGSGDFTLIK
jgi:uridylate kinase